MGAGVARLAVVLAHRGEVHGLVSFAPGLVYFVAPAGASFAMIRAVRTRVELPGLLLLGPVVLAVAELLLVLLALALAVALLLRLPPAIAPAFGGGPRAP